MSALIGKTLNGRYRVEEYIGGGGMADVYKVWDVRRSCYLAVKVMRQSLSEFQEFGERFRREADVLARLQHPNIVRFYGIEEADDIGTSFIVMDYVDGPTLATKLKTSRHPLSTQEMVPLTDDIAAALDFAHEHGIIHRDIKPSNILISRDGRGLLSDFGIARLSDAMTMTYHGIGTPAYMSPEHCEGKELTATSDVYSLGVVLYEALTGRRPFIGDLRRGEVATSASIMREHVEMPPPPPSEINPAIRPAVEAVLFKCLAKSQQYRYQSGADLASDLHSAAGIKIIPALRVSSIPGGAEVALDGRTAGVTPLEIATITPGRHTLKIALKGYEPHTQTIQLPDQSVVDVRLQAVPPPQAPIPRVTPASPPAPPPTVAVPSPATRPVAPERAESGPPPPRARPPTRTGGGGDDRKPPWLLLGIGGAVAGVAMLAIIALVLMGGGGGGDDDESPTPSVTSGSSTATRSATPTKPPTRTPTPTPADATPPVETPLEFAGQVSQPDATRTHNFQGKAGDIVTIVMRQDGSASLNLFVTLLDPAGEELASEGCNSSASEARLLNVPLPADGRYTIQAEGCNGTTGKYVISLEKKPPVETTAYGGEVSGVIDLSDDYQDWFFEGRAGDVITARVLREGSASLTPYVYLYDSGNAELKTGGCGFDGESRIQNHRLQFDGTYRLRVTGCNDSIGSFRLSLSVEPSAGELPYGSSAMNGSIVINDDYEDWTFEGVAGDVVTIRAVIRTSNSLTPYISLRDRDGNELKTGGCGFDGESRIQNYPLPFTGPYRVRVTGCNDSSGDYSISNAKE